MLQQSLLLAAAVDDTHVLGVYRPHFLQYIGIGQTFPSSKHGLRRGIDRAGLLTFGIGAVILAAVHNLRLPQAL